MEPLNKRLNDADPAAFVELYDELGDRLFRYVLAQTGCRQNAADITQNIFLRLVKSHRKLAQAENLTAYVFRIARTETIRWHNKLTAGKTKSVPDVEQVVSSFRNDSGNFTEQIESRDWINRTLARLDPIDREIVQLKIFSQLTFQEISEILKLPQANIATKYRRALMKMEKQIGRDTLSQEREQ